VTLGPQNAKHIEAAEGWLELGNILETNAEIDEVRAHPEVPIAATLTDQLPEVGV